MQNTAMHCGAFENTVNDSPVFEGSLASDADFAQGNYPQFIAM